MQRNTETRSLRKLGAAWPSRGRETSTQSGETSARCGAPAQRRAARRETAGEKRNSRPHQGI